MIGVAAVSFTGYGGRAEEVTLDVPVYNLVPTVGEPARFAFSAAGVGVYLDTAVRTGSDYGVTVNVNNISQLEGFAGSQVTFWGVPGDTVHDTSRGPDCVSAGLLGDYKQHMRRTGWPPNRTSHTASHHS